ncbi:MAG TPA: hypothetical protein DCE44_12425 [Verrucomicrobiales bacterium]|nr:hypothetical protein [Verrucomicrobiales bacterium]
MNWEYFASWGAGVRYLSRVALLSLVILQGRVNGVDATSLGLPLLPELEQYVVEPTFPGLEASWATGLVFAPGDTNRIFLLGKSGNLFVITNLAQPKLTTFLDLTSKTFADSESGLLGLAFHPGWRTNRQFYVYYSTTLPVDGQPTLHQRLARFLIDPADPNHALLDSEQPLISQKDPNSNHNAGDLEFGPDGYLYVSLGDGGGAFDTYRNTQIFHDNFFSAILRIDPDRRQGNLVPNPHPAIHPGTYLVPADNPLLGLTSYFQQPIRPDKLRTEFYAIGFRNPFRIAFDPATGKLYANDVGQNRREEINHVVAGGNYGWNFYEGSIAWPFGLIDEPYATPLFEYEHEQGLIAITGGAWYHGNRYPDLKDTYVFADFGGPVGSLKLNPTGPPTVRWIARFPGITDVQVNQGTDELLFSTFNNGVVAKLVLQRRSGPPIPTLLSQTGVFADLATLRPNPGVQPYEINVPFWSDHADKQRWYFLPPDNPKLAFFPRGPWISPEGAVWIKHFELEMNKGNPASRRRVETRVLVRFGTGNELWGATYRWNDAQTDAELVPSAGRDETFQVVDGGLVRPQKWRYPGRDECLSCHNAAAGGLLGFTTAQLNRTVERAGQVTNQLEAMIAAGNFHNPPPGVASLPALAPASDERWTIDYRVHSYLAANCSYCHFPGGPTRATWDGRITTPLNQAGLVGQMALNNLQDIYAFKNTYLVAPGDVQTSAVFRRVAELAPYHMPPLATAELNTSAIQLLGAWITNSLPTRMFTYSAWTNALEKDFPGIELPPAADPDGDGLSNELEFLLKEHPLNGTRQWVPQLAGSPGNWRMKFVRKANLRFEVQWTTALGLGWQPVEAPENRWFVGTSDQTVEVPLPSSAETSFYRVLVAGP